MVGQAYAKLSKTHMTKKTRQDDSGAMRHPTESEQDRDRLEDKIEKLRRHALSAEKIGSQPEAEAFFQKIEQLEHDDRFGVERSIVAQIRELWGDTREKNLEVARLLLFLKPRKKIWNDYGLPFGHSWGKKLMKIARDRRIVEHYDVMPECSNCTTRNHTHGQQAVPVGAIRTDHPSRSFEGRHTGVGSFKDGCAN